MPSFSQQGNLPNQTLMTSSHQHDVSIEPHLKLLSGEVLHTRSTSTEDNAKPDVATLPSMGGGGGGGYICGKKLFVTFFVISDALRQQILFIYLHTELLNTNTFCHLR